MTSTAVITPSQKCVDDEEPDEDWGRMPKSENAIMAIYMKYVLLGSTSDLIINSIFIMKGDAYMGGLIFDESTLINGNVFKFEQRLHSHMNKYVENGALLTIYFSQDENSSTVDRGLQDIEALFGNKAPLRYTEIRDFPLYGFDKATPENTDEQQIEDINVNGNCLVLPSSIVPKVMDFFIVKHLKMDAIFEITNVDQDSMKPDGYYQISYRLHSTSKETIAKLRNQVTSVMYTDLNAIGSDRNPIIKEDDFILRGKIEKMVNVMIDNYRAMFYDRKHNCFLFRDPDTGYDIFDMCGNEFMAKFSIMNYPNSSNVIVLNHKIDDKQFPIRYANSVYQWIEMGAPLKLVRKFEYLLDDASCYPLSSFARYSMNTVMVMQPLSTREVGIVTDKHEFFDHTTFMCLMGNEMPVNDYEKLLWKYAHNTNINIHDISLDIADCLISSVYHRDIFLYTPIIIYIIREILRMN